MFGSRWSLVLRRVRVSGVRRREPIHTPGTVYSEEPQGASTREER